MYMESTVNKTDFEKDALLTQQLKGVANISVTFLNTPPSNGIVLALTRTCSYATMNTPDDLVFDVVYRNGSGNGAMMDILTVHAGVTNSKE